MEGQVSQVTDKQQVELTPRRSAYDREIVAVPIADLRVPDADLDRAMVEKGGVRGVTAQGIPVVKAKIGKKVVGIAAGVVVFRAEDEDGGYLVTAGAARVLRARELGFAGTVDVEVQRLAGDGRELIAVNPNHLVSSRNRRTDDTPDATLLGSVAAVGVQSPIVVQLDWASGLLIVLHGHRRRRAAIETQQATVPVMVERAFTGSDDEQQLSEAVSQYFENEVREGFDAPDKAAIIQEVLDLGFSEAEVAEKLQVDATTVAAVVKLRRSKKAVEALAGGADVLQSAAIAELEAHPDLQEALYEAAQEGEFEWGRALASANRQAAHRAARAEEIARLEAQKVKLLDRVDAGLSGPKMRSLEQLLGADGVMTPEEHAACPGHAAFLYRGSSRATYLCQDVPGHRHKLSVVGGGTTPNSPLSDEEKAALKRTRQNNVAMIDVNTARRTWIKQKLLPRAAKKGLPGWEAALLVAVSEDDRSLRKAMERGHAAAHEALGLPVVDQMYQRRVRLALTGKRGKVTGPEARRRLIAIYVMAHEAKIKKDAWRNPPIELREYYAQLIAWGYQPGEVDAEIGLLPEGDNLFMSAAGAAEVADDEVDDEAGEDDDEEFAEDVTDVPDESDEPDEPADQEPDDDLTLAALDALAEEADAN
jgi:ParB family chromosome partitioning protein